MPFAVPAFVAEDNGGSQYAEALSRVVAANLTSTGLFREVPPDAHIARITSFDASVSYSDWRAVNAQALIVGAVAANGDNLTVKFRLFDVVSGQQMGQGMQFAGGEQDWRRMAHKVSDAVYSQITGESGYFDSRVVFVAESGPRTERVKRLAIMDQDGENIRTLTDGRSLVIAPRVSPTGDRAVYTTYQKAAAHHCADGSAVGTGAACGRDTRRDEPSPPRVLRQMVARWYFSAGDGRHDRPLFRLELGHRADGAAGPIRPLLPKAPSVLAAMGRSLTFESDRSGNQPRFNVMPAQRGRRASAIAFGPGPLFHPRLVRRVGDMRSPFTKSLMQGAFYISGRHALLTGRKNRLLNGNFP